MKSKRGYVFDTTCLNYFALTDSLYLIKDHLGTDCFIPREVRQEIINGINEYPSLEPKLKAVLDAEWLQELIIDDIDDLRLFANLRRRWGQADRNYGEAAALVLAKRYELVAVIDDPVGRKASRSLDVICIGTVGLLAMLAALDKIDEEDAWRLHSQMTNLTTGPYRSPIKSKFDFSQLVKDVARKMHL